MTFLPWRFLVLGRLWTLPLRKQSFAKDPPKPSSPWVWRTLPPMLTIAVDSSSCPFLGNPFNPNQFQADEIVTPCPFNCCVINLTAKTKRVPAEMRYSCLVAFLCMNQKKISQKHKHNYNTNILTMARFSPLQQSKYSLCRIQHTGNAAEASMGVENTTQN